MNSKKNKQRGRAEFSNNTRGKFNNDQEKSKDALLKKTSQKYEEKHGNTVMNSKKSKHWSKTVFSDNTSDKVNDQEETNVELLLKSLQEHREEVSFLKEENKKLQDELHKFTTLCKCQSKEKIKEEPSQIDDYGTKIPPSCSSYYSTDAQYKQGSQGDISSASGLKENTWEDDYDLMNLQPSCSSYHSTDAHLYQQGSQGNNTSTNDLEENTWERNFHPSTNSRKYYSKGYSKSSDREEKLSRNKERSSEFRRGNESSCYQIKEMEGDLFTAPNDYSLAHCVAEDLQMGSGIAVQFKRDFKNVEELLCQKKKVGQVAVLQSGERFIYYLITKRFSVGKPIFDDLRKALVNMRKHMEENQVKKLAIPRLGCGLDRLKWKEVRATLQEIFRETEIEIVVYTFMQDTTSPTRFKSSIFIVEKTMKLVNIEAQTLLILFGSAHGDVDETMIDIDNKFPIIVDYKKKMKKLGDVIVLEKRSEILCILIVKENKNENVSYIALKTCIKELQKVLKKNNLGYLGFEAFIDGDDDIAVYKIIALFKMYFKYSGSELWVCWPPKLEDIYHRLKRESTYSGEKLSY